MTKRIVHLVGAQKTNYPWGVECRLIRALENLGHKIISTDFRKNRDNLSDLLMQPADLLIVCRGDGIPPEFIERIPWPTALWYAELIGSQQLTDRDAESRRRELAFNCHAFDYVFLHDASGIEVCKDLGGRRVSYLTPAAVDTILNKKLSIPKKYDITFVGSQTERRKQFIDVIRTRFDIHTPNIWEPHELNILYNQSKIVLNLHLSGLPNTEVRLCEVLGAGSFMLTERPSMKDFLIDGKHLCFFSHNSIEDCFNKIDYYLKHDDEREQIALEGYRFVNSFHTHEKRIEQLLDHIDFKLKKELWPSYGLGVPFNSHSRPTLRLESFYEAISSTLETTAKNGNSEIPRNFSRSRNEFFNRNELDNNGSQPQMRKRGNIDNGRDSHRKVRFQVKDNFVEIKQDLEELELGGGAFTLCVEVSRCSLDEWLWLRQKRQEGLIDALILTEEGRKEFPTVSIVLFTYDRLEYSKETLKTLMRNTHYPFVLYIIDNNSSDGTQEWLNEMRLLHADRIQHIQFNRENEGLAGPTNAFWRSVNSDLIGKIDNDTLVPEGWLLRLVEAHKRIPKLAVVGGYHFRPEDFNHAAAQSKIYEENGIHVLTDTHIGGCCYLMKKSIQKELGEMEYDKSLKTHGWTQYQWKLVQSGYLVGYLYPLVQLEYMDDPRSEKCLIANKYKDYARKIWRERGVDFQSTDQLVNWIRNDAVRVTTNPRAGGCPSTLLQEKSGNPQAILKKAISIIILTHNQLDYTKLCLESILKHTRRPVELIFVDNGSTDGTVTFLESAILKQQPDVEINIIRNKTNRGFSAGNNQGMAVAAGEYILLLNNDVVVTPGWLDRMIACLERQPQIGIVGPRSNYVSGPQLVTSVSYNVDTLKGLTGYSADFAAENADKATPILRVVGFCMLIKRSVIEKIGGMDERYGLGNFEDDDFSLRAAFAGFESWMAHDCFIHHFGSRTFAGEKIDFRKSLQMNWDIFKKKWELPDELPYGSPYGLSQIPIDGFDPARHYFPLPSNENYANDEMTNELISVERQYVDIQQEVDSSNPEETIDKLESLLVSYPDFAPAYNDLGVLYYNFGNKEKAVNYYQKAARLEPGNITFQKNLADFLYVESGMVEEALQIYVKILTICPEDIETLLITGHICVAINKFDDAEEFYNRVLEIDSRNEGARKNLEALKNYKANNDNQMSGESHTFLDSKKETDTFGGNQLSNLQSKTDDHRCSVSIIMSLEGIQNCLENCLKYIEQHTPETYEIIFLNSGATKAVLKWTKRLVEKYQNYRLLNIGKNIGWPECINRGIRASSGEFIVILHNDVVVSEAWLSDMLECINRDSKIGLVAPMTNKADGIQKDININYRSIDHFETYAKKFRKLNRYRRVPIKNISEICLLFRQELIEEIGCFDENLKTAAVAVEDLCSRMALQGYKNVVAADVYIHHYDRHNTKKNRREMDQIKVEDRKVLKEKFDSLEIKSRESEKFQALKILDRADELNQKGQVDQAIDTLLSGIGTSPNEQKLYLNLAEILLNAGRFKDALDALSEMPEKEEAVSTNDQKLQKYILLGHCEEGLGRYQEAEGHTDRALSLNPSSASALNLKGILAFKQNNKEAAEELFKKATNYDPGYGESYTNLGALKWQAGKEKDALQLYEKGFILTPTDLDIATNYHSAIGALGEFEQTHRVALDAAAMHPYNKKIQYLLIDILIQLGKYDRAIFEIEAAIVKFGINDGILSAALKIREILGPNQISEAQRRTAVSLCMIVKDEEQYLAHCLASVKPIVDEMIVVDSGSADSTKDIALSFGAKVYDYDWNHNFAEARNFSISKASGNWILIMDADEVISHLDYPKFEEIVKVPPKSPAAISIITRNYCTLANTIGWVANDGKYSQEEAGVGWIPSVKVRLFYGKDLIWFEGVVHELLDPVLKRKGIKIEQCRIPIHHYGRLNKGNLDRKGEIYFEIGKKKLEEMGNDLTALRELAVQATIIGKNEDAIELWERLLALKPDSKLSAEVFINMGTVYSRMGKYQDALYASKKAIEYSPGLKEAKYNYAMAELHLGNAAKTIEVLENMLTKIPDYPPAQFILVAAYSCHGNKERALEGLKKLKSSQMSSVSVFSCVELAKGLILADQIDYAISLLGAAIDSEIVNADLLNLFKECLNIKENTDTFGDINTQLSMPAKSVERFKNSYQ